ncbi:hypothetical protein BU25DRAFT_217844 [Macroventuria anomochaeta]|uniref:Uncharacterized protein n=1 Tax=Macroventuria anomochaeta TaxID=301207 RepID=A0ACB6RM88_9PLEO|nr:uncharacterized protein BU25DRAFT_217844 [Macroventuria anomochaeta]KAF2622044.1 hypothetical protein BU25DRAFT_217844 [Macroventuria anomochaeta]
MASLNQQLFFFSLVDILCCFDVFFSFSFSRLGFGTGMGGSTLAFMLRLFALYPRAAFGVTPLGCKTATRFSVLVHGFWGMGCAIQDWCLVCRAAAAGACDV